MQTMIITDKASSENIYLGIELGSTRIKAMVIDATHRPLATSESIWENRLEQGYWTYSLDEVWSGLQNVIEGLTSSVDLSRISALGISAMMHGYLVFDVNGEQLTAFRTWRNTTTAEAAALLSEAFAYNIPQRWSIAHLYQAILDDEKHVAEIGFLTTLAGYVHWRLCGEKVLGVGDASGMFPIANQGGYDQEMLKVFDGLIAEKGYPWSLETILPRPLSAGLPAGRLSEAGAVLLDPSGRLKAGTSLCPPEGDAGTGMVATNSIAPRTGNISAGTSIFAMAVLEKPLQYRYAEIDCVTTPVGDPVAMVHCNNCTSDIDAWIGLLEEAARSSGALVSRDALYAAFYRDALGGEADAGGLLCYNYLSGEPITGLSEGRPLLVRLPDSKLSFSNFARAMLFAAIATLKIGMDLLREKEGLVLDLLAGHGGVFKAPRTGQQLLAAALHTPVAVMASAGEGGAWGIAILAAYLLQGEGSNLQSYLTSRVFASAKTEVVDASVEDCVGFAAYMERYVAGLEIERTAVQKLEA